MNRILHITPALPPFINGLGDFSFLLAKSLGTRGFDNSFLVVKTDPLHQKSKTISAFTQDDFDKKLIDSNPGTIILHYAGYAYHQKGLPFYLTNGLKKFKRRTGCKILVFFHELYSSSNNPFRLSFYTNSLQKKIVKDLYEIADRTFTNCILYQDLLFGLLLTKPVKNICTGLFSNIPEELYDETVEKENELVVFGSLERRNAVYNSSSFVQLVKNNEIKAIYDIGPETADFNHPQLQLQRLGCLEAREVAHYFNKARFGFIEYPSGLMGKSGIFSAYAAFGMITFNLYKKDETLYDGLTEGKNYFTADADFPDDYPGYERARLEILKWYKKRNQSAITDIIIKQIKVYAKENKMPDLIGQPES